MFGIESSKFKTLPIIQVQKFRKSFNIFMIESKIWITLNVKY